MALHPAPNIHPTYLYLQGVSFEQKLIEVDTAYRRTYNMAADLWYEAWLLIKEAKEQGRLLVTPKVGGRGGGGGGKKEGRLLVTPKVRGGRGAIPLPGETVSNAPPANMADAQSTTATPDPPYI